MDLTERASTFAALGDPSRLAIVDLLAMSDATATELAGELDAPSNLLAHHLRVLADAGLVERRQSEGDRRRRYVMLRRDRLPWLSIDSSRLRGTPLFVCTANSARSQFAAAMWERTTGVPALSAGSSPAPRVHPVAVRVAAEFGVDLSSREPRGYATITLMPDVVISVCDRARETSPPRGTTNLHWSIPDPVPHRTTAAFRGAFAEIDERIASLTNTKVPTKTKEHAP